MTGGWWSRFWVAGLVAAALVASSCNANHTKPRPRTEQPMAQTPDTTVADAFAKQKSAAEAATRERAGALKPGEPIWIRSGKSRVIELRNPIKRVSIGNPDLAGIVVLGPKTIVVNAKEAPGANGGGNENAPRSAGVVTGRTLTPEPHLGETSLILWDGDSAKPDVHTLFVADFAAQQVMLEVTVAELNRTAMEQHGIDFRNMATTFASAYFMGGGLGPASIGSVPPATNLPIATTSTAPNYAFHLPNQDITAFIQLLQSEGLATVLAQPKLLAMSGQNAVFQVGGEIPIRIATGFATDIQFKPFGTIVNFIPRVSDEGDIMLTVTPEVSQPDFNSPVEGIPSFRTRRASTSVRLQNAETLVVGGLLQEERTENVRGVPYLQDLPVVGYIFRSTTYSSTVTELLVVVTPHLVQTLPSGEQIVLPTDRGPLTSDDVRTQPNPAEMSRPRLPFVP